MNYFAICELKNRQYECIRVERKNLATKDNGLFAYKPTDERNLWHCGCKYCGIDAQAYWEEKWAIDAWNTRTPQNDEMRE